MNRAGADPGPEPQSYHVRMSTWWWLGGWRFLKFILRELSSVFVAWFVVISLLLLRALNQGPDAYARFQEWLKEPLLITLNAVSLIFVLFHTVTWFNAAPRAMAVRVKGQRVPDAWIAGFHYVAWLMISGVVAWLVLRK